MNAERIERMRDALQQALAPSVLEIEDDSHRHAGHAGARDGRGHFNVHVAVNASPDWGHWPGIARSMPRWAR